LTFFFQHILFLSSFLRYFPLTSTLLHPFWGQWGKHNQGVAFTGYGEQMPL